MNLDCKINTHSDQSTHKEIGESSIRVIVNSWPVLNIAVRVQFLRLAERELLQLRSYYIHTNESRQATRQEPRFPVSESTLGIAFFLSKLIDLFWIANSLHSSGHAEWVKRGLFDRVALRIAG